MDTLKQPWNAYALNNQKSYTPHCYTLSDMSVPHTKKIPNPPAVKQITTKEENFIERVVSTFLYYGRAVNPTVLHVLSSIASSKQFGMKALAATTYLLHYLATHPDAILRYHASGMVLCVHSDVSNLTETKAQS